MTTEASSPPPSTQPPGGDQANISPALFGFYACCAFVSLGAGMFFFALFVMTKEGYGSVPTVMKVVGGAFMGIGAPGCFYCLSRARAENQLD